MERQALPPRVEHRLLNLQRTVGNSAVVAALRTVQRCGATPPGECPCHDEDKGIEPPGVPVQRSAEVLPWIWGAAETGAKAVGAGLGAVAAGIAAGAAVLFTPNTSIMSGSEEAWRLGVARIQSAIRTIAQDIAEITAMATISQAVVDQVKGVVEGAIEAMEDQVRRAGSRVMRCSNELMAFRAVAQQIRDLLSKPLDQINKFQLLRLYDEFNKALGALVTCLGLEPPSDDGGQTG